MVAGWLHDEYDACLESINLSLNGGYVSLDSGYVTFNRGYVCFNGGYAGFLSIACRQRYVNVHLALGNVTLIMFQTGNLGG